MNKPSVDAQLAFMRREFDYFYQVYNTDNNQIFALKRTGVESILSIIFIEPENKIDDWISSTEKSLRFFVSLINSFLNQKGSGLRLVTFYRDIFRPDLEIDGFKFAQFVIGFEKVVSDRDYELIWEGVKEAIVKYSLFGNKINGADIEYGWTIEINDLVESFGDVEDQVWNVNEMQVATTYEQKRRYFLVEGDVIRYTLQSDASKTYSGEVTKIYQNSNSILIGQNATFNVSTLLENYFIEIIKYVDLNKNKKKDDVIVAPSPSPSGSFDVRIEDVKKEIGQLIFLRSLQSPLDFEDNISLNQLLKDKQKELDRLIFEKMEQSLSQENIFDDLFEQSFTPIQNSYENIFVKDEGSSDFFTPNGERSLLNDAENALIRTPLFLEWFGDWQLAFQYQEAGINDFACSKVLSPKFEPQIVWHGTGTEFSYFRFDNFPAAYFAVNKAYSQWFADLHSRDGDGFTIPFFLNVRNPLDLTIFETRKIDPKTFFDYMFLQTGLTRDELDINPIFADSNLDPMETWVYLRNNPKMLKKLSDTKIFDGIHFYETNPSIEENEPFYKTEAWIIFDPHQAKLADPSRGVLLFSSLKSFLLKKGGKL